MLNNPYLQYRNATVQTASPTQLVLLSYQGVIRFIQRGLQGLERGNLEEAHAGLVRAQDIIGELLVSLDMEAGGEVATSLAALYSYSTRRLVEANVKKHPEPALDVLRLFRELLPAWQTVANQERAGATRQAVRVAV